jgi:hypothetical protein
MSDAATATARQRQTAKGRRAFLDTLPSPEARSEHFRDLARRSAAGRVVLSRDDALALNEAYRLLETIAARGKIAAPADVRHASGQPGDAADTSSDPNRSPRET